ncbi:DUF6597 domain-containing transcriptional factor [Mucilaginibacter sp. HD30]
MSFKVIHPPAALQPYVRYFWILESEEDASEKNFRTMADGCPGIIFQHPDSGNFFQESKKLPDAFLFGQTTRYAELNLSGKFSTVGVYLQPNALKALFRLKAEEFTDACLNLSLFAKSGETLSEELTNTDQAGERVALISAYLTRQLEINVKRQDPAMDFALNQMIRSEGQIALAKLQNELQLTERSFHRKFKEHTGIAPKLFTRIIRFQASLKQLAATDYHKLSDLAYSHEYADQSHFIRSFKEFSGMSPMQFQKQTQGVIDNLAEVIK